MRLTRVLTACGLAVAVLVGGAGAASAAGNDDEESVNGNHAVQAFGNSALGGPQVPQLGLLQEQIECGGSVQGKPGSHHQCAQGSTQAAGDELSTILDDVPAPSGNGAANN
ncbi:RdlA protein [Streptomyces anulatus]|uniref:RdlA protein n=1 Tax=Streptomyces anulatus TaxID=1892 RepID=A0ABZ1ZSZ9_STRAQ|nr:RdlA protein [Streptomyces anulatus]WST82992.1 RdlA protein [Streptomyces anulatus]